jgi:hypothetical protein
LPNSERIIKIVEMLISEYTELYKSQTKLIQEGQGSKKTASDYYLVIQALRRVIDLSKD